MIAHDGGRFKGTLTTVLLMHEGGVRGVGQRLYISQINVLLVVSAGYSMLRVVAFVSIVPSCLSLLSLDELLSVIDRAHNIVITRLLHHLWVYNTVYSFQLAISSVLGIAIIYTW